MIGYLSVIEEIKLPHLTVLVLKHTFHMIILF